MIDIAGAGAGAGAVAGAVAVLTLPTRYYSVRIRKANNWRSYNCFSLYMEY